MFNFFKKTRDSLTISDWLANMLDAFRPLGDEVLAGDKTSPNMLAMFTIVATTNTANNMLHQAPSLVARIDKLYVELRCYYDSLWQLCLLIQAKSDSDVETIQNLYAFVGMRIRSIYESLFKQNPNIKNLFAEVVSDQYEQILDECTPLYIHEMMRRGGDPLVYLPVAFTKRLPRHNLDERESAAVFEVILKETANSVGLKFLTQFDLGHCDIPSLPDSWLRRPPPSDS